LQHSCTKPRKWGKAQRLARPACANAIVHFLLTDWLCCEPFEFWWAPTISLERLQVQLSRGLPQVLSS